MVFEQPSEVFAYAECFGFDKAVVYDVDFLRCFGHEFEFVVVAWKVVEEIRFVEVSHEFLGRCHAGEAEFGGELVCAERIAEV